MAKKTEDQSGGQTVSRLGLSHCCQQPVRNDGERDAAHRVRLWIEENFCMNDIIRRSPVKIGQRQIAKILRSEEHTSELQSLMRISYAVFCLKKKKKTNNNTNIHTITKIY